MNLKNLGQGKWQVVPGKGWTRESIEWKGILPSRKIEIKKFPEKKLKVKPGNQPSSQKNKFKGVDWGKWGGQG